MFNDRARTERPPLPPAWRGVRLRRLEVGADPDCAVEPAIIPVAWPDTAAAGLVAVRRSPRLVTAAEAAAAWIDPIDQPAPECVAIGATLHELLITRRASPSAAVWRGRREAIPAFVFNVPMFLNEAGDFDIPGFVRAVEVAVIALHRVNPDAERLALGMADLALLLARLDLDYASDLAKATTATLAGLLSAQADIASAALAGHGTAAEYPIVTPILPSRCALAGLSEAATAAQACAARLGFRRHRSLTGITAPGPVEALLGVETTGIAAPLSALNGDGSLAAWARARLAASACPSESALAATLAGSDPFGVADPAAMRDMYAAVAPFCAILPEPQIMGSVRAAPAGARRDKLPARRGGYTQKATLGGHKIFLRTGDYQDGRLGEISFALPRESAAMRGMADALARAVSIGLQHGVPLEAFIEEFAFSRFGVAGAVEGDDAITEAGSVLDYAFRHLAVNYLGRQDLAGGPQEQDEQPLEPAPRLPLDLPEAGRSRPMRLRPALKLVS